ncbi:tetratricopeptide repeat protein [Ciceribacter sp. L1K22]|uniref:tetratricopeptide repeat protein n=1 Tax=Ciceribacter sp. L1K22 TaxID=2820275 RepID=UPI001ABDF319|nr:tetratricopeptide repeat protein [Ciceribacter sp. L1K22]MBO3761878.1 sel1 repeat family protein [Ciceribacter sp. L1K22]
MAFRAHLTSALFASLISLATAALAQDGGGDAVNRPLEDDATILDRTGRPGTGQPEEGAAGAEIQGLSLYERMGAPLPEPPPEKPYDGPLDEAYGAFQRGLYLTALDKALPRAQLGDPTAQTLIAEMTTRGLGVKRDPKAAAFWYGQAAAGGDPNAMFQYALLLMEGRHVERDKAKADDFMRKAADAGNASAQFNWAQTLVSDNPGRKGLQLALPYYEKSADQGVADAQYAVAQLYNTLPGVSDDKRVKARDYMLRAAKAGFDTAELDIGIWYVNGIAGERDYDQGFQWLSRAARRGNVVAQNRLSHLYINALGTRPDPVEAAKWYVLSRRAGLTDAGLEDFYLGLTEEQQKKAIDAANRFRVK